MTLNFFILLVFYFFIRGLQDESNRGTPYYLAYLCMGIGFMIKGPPAILIPALSIGGFIFILRDREKFSQLRLGYGMAILMSIILPWFVTMFAIHGDEFKNHLLGAELRDRITHDTPFSLYYLGVTVRYYLPWSLFFIAALAVRFGFTSITSPEVAPAEGGYFSSLPEKLKTRCCELVSKDNQPFLFSMLWITGPLLLFTLFRIEHSRYMLPVSPAITMITAHFLSELIASPSDFQRSVFKVPFYLTGIFYFLIIIFTGISVLTLSSVFSPPLVLIILSVLGLCAPMLLLLLYKLKKYFAMIITLSIIQIITLTSLSGDAIPFFNRYPKKIFANQILAAPQADKRIGLYQLGNHRARIGIMTGLPSIYLNTLEELKLFIKSGKNIYVVMRQSDWQHEFQNLPMTMQATDTGWGKLFMNKSKIGLLLKDGLKPHLSKYSEGYVLLKAADNGKAIE